MKYFLEVFSIVLIFCLGNAAMAEGDRENGSHSNTVNYQKKRSPGTVFPTYPARAPRANPKGANHFASVPAHSDSLGNRVTQDHLNRVEFAHGRADKVMKKDVRVTDVVRQGRARFVNVYRPEFEHRTVVFNGFIHNYNTLLIEHPHTVGLWRQHFFFGGFYYGFHPVAEIDTYFYNPLVYWFYVPTFDDYYYRSWYKTEYDAYPDLHHPFEYHGLYYPTENLRLLLFGVSAMPVEKQVQFRQAISLFTKKLAKRLANAFNKHVNLANGDIAITHYEVVGYDDAVVLEGFVTFEGTQYNFKGLLNFESIQETNVFAPVALDKDPSSEQLKSLDDLNEKIDSLKGEATPPPVETLNNEQPSGSVTADPGPANE